MDAVHVSRMDSRKCWLKFKKKQNIVEIFLRDLWSSKSFDKEWLISEVMWDTVIQDISRYKLGDSVTIQIPTNLSPNLQI